VFQNYTDKIELGVLCNKANKNVCLEILPLWVTAWSLIQQNAIVSRLILIYEQQFTTSVRSDGLPSVNTTYATSLLTVWCLWRCQMYGRCRCMQSGCEARVLLLFQQYFHTPRSWCVPRWKRVTEVWWPCQLHSKSADTDVLVYQLLGGNSCRNHFQTHVYMNFSTSFVM
jgi:hypothetical protein